MPPPQPELKVVPPPILRVSQPHPPPIQTMGPSDSPPPPQPAELHFPSRPDAKWRPAAMHPGSRSPALRLLSFPLPPNASDSHHPPRHTGSAIPQTGSEAPSLSNSAQSTMGDVCPLPPVTAALGRDRGLHRDPPGGFKTPPERSEPPRTHRETPRNLQSAPRSLSVPSGPTPVPPAAYPGALRPTPVPPAAYPGSPPAPAPPPR